MNDIPTILLASQSPRRHELLNLAGIPHKIFVSGADEGSVEYTPGYPEEFVTAAAKLKNNAVRNVLEQFDESAPADIPLTAQEIKNSVILSADTIVYSDIAQTIYGKPGNVQRAVEMLHELSGHPHRVITGVMLYDTATGNSVHFAESTDVYFRHLDDREIEAYIRRYNPLDKAGAYGIQDGACVFVEKIVGDYYNVVGLPVCRVYTELKKLLNFN